MSLMGSCPRMICFRLGILGWDVGRLGGFNRVKGGRYRFRCSCKDEIETDCLMYINDLFSEPYSWLV